MRIIKEMVEHIDEEIEGAKEYAEKFIEHKAKGSPRATYYRQMALDELSHAEKIHEFAVADIEEIAKIKPPTVEMEEKWKHEHKKYVETVAMIKTMLN